MQNAHEVVDAIIKDLTNRRGLSQEWDQIDPDIKEEIRNTWAGLITVGLYNKAEDLDRRVTALENRGKAP
jgi:hypothetical protein